MLQAEANLHKNINDILLIHVLLLLEPLEFLLQIAPIREFGHYTKFVLVAFFKKVEKLDDVGMVGAVKHLRLIHDVLLLLVCKVVLRIGLQDQFQVIGLPLD